MRLEPKAKGYTGSAFPTTTTITNKPGSVTTWRQMIVARTVALALIGKVDSPK